MCVCVLYYKLRLVLFFFILVPYRKVSEFIRPVPFLHLFSLHMFFIPLRCRRQSIKLEINLGGVLWEARVLLVSVESWYDRGFKKKKLNLDSFFFEISVIYKLTLVLFSQLCFRRWEWLHLICSSVCKVLAVWQPCWWFSVLVGLHWLPQSCLAQVIMFMKYLGSLWLFCVYGWNILHLAYISFSDLG